MEALTANVNWLAVIVGTALAYGLGMLWYSPKMFGPKWMKGVGLTKKDMNGAGSAMVAQLVATFLLAWVIGVTETSNDIALAVLIALMAGSLIKSNGLWAKKSHYAIAVEAGYVLVMVIIMIATHAVI